MCVRWGCERLGVCEGGGVKGWGCERLGVCEGGACEGGP